MNPPRWWSRIALRLLPPHIAARAARAEHEARESRLEMKATAVASAKVEDLDARMTADLRRNHYADRFAFALGKLKA